MKIGDIGLVRVFSTTQYAYSFIVPGNLYAYNIKGPMPMRRTPIYYTTFHLFIELKQHTHYYNDDQGWFQLETTVVG